MQLRFARNVSEAEMKAGKAEHLKYGGGGSKTYAQLYIRNIHDKAAHYVQYKLRPAPGRNVWPLEDVVMAMLNSKKFILASEWAK